MTWDGGRHSPGGITQGKGGEKKLSVGKREARNRTKGKVNITKTGGEKGSVFKWVELWRPQIKERKKNPPKKKSRGSKIKVPGGSGGKVKAEEGAVAETGV